MEKFSNDDKIFSFMVRPKHILSITFCKNRKLSDVKTGKKTFPSGY